MLDDHSADRGDDRGDDRFDVVVVGGRVAGAGTALLLARAGLRVLVLDRGQQGSDTLSTHALTRGGVIQLKRWGVLEALIARGTPPIRRTTFHYAEETVALDMEPRDGIDALYGPRRTVIDLLLVETARDAGAEIRHGCKVNGLLRDEVGGVVGVSFVDLETGADHRASASIVVGADGARSIVARDVGSATTWVGTESGAMLYGYFRDPGIDSYHWFYRPRATAGLIPTNDDQVCMWVGTPSDRYMRDLRGDPGQAFGVLLSEAAPEYSEIFHPDNVVGRFFGYAGQPAYLRQAAGPGWALVGDAGYFKDPLTAHGITDALRDADLLASAIMDTVGTDDFSPLVDYQERRDQLSIDFADVTNRIASYEWDTHEIKALVREEGRLLADEARLLGAAGRADGRLIRQL